MAQAVDDDKQTTRDWRRFKNLKIKKGTFKRQARKIELVSIKHAHKFITRRWANVRNVGRSTLSWLLLVGLLIGLSTMQLSWFQRGYMTEGPVSGGLLAEGMVGRLETVNPLYVAERPERAAERLIFSSLLSYDRDNKLRPDAAASWSVSEDGRTYSVSLRDDIFWHDGKKMTINDVIFTVRLMQNAEAKSALYNSWAGVKVEKKGNNAVDFVLPTTYAPFAHALTFSILPEHVLRDVPVRTLREHPFGRNPVGSGPFRFKRVQIINPKTNRIVVHMEANDRYFRGSPRLDRFQIHTFESSEALRKGILSGEVNTAFGLNSDDVRAIREQYPDVVDTNLTIENGMFALFNNDSPLLNNADVRKALVLATDRSELITKTLHGQGVSLVTPLPGQSAATGQAEYDKTAAASLLDAAGWVAGENGVRAKDGVKLELILVSSDTGDYPAITTELAKQWGEVGVHVTVKQVKADEIIAHYIQPRAYDVLVNELSIGADPDVYAYWHSSQAKATGLNFANYKSAIADDILSSARTRLDPTLRDTKYLAFTEQWVKDAPAIALYQPKANYLAITSVTTGENNRVVADTPTRFRYVEQWTAQTSRVYKTP